MSYRLIYQPFKSFLMYMSIFLCLLSILSGCGDDDDATTASSPPVVYMWVSSSTTDGNIGGLNAAHTICETDSSSVSFNTSVDTHRALIEFPSYDPSNIFANDPVVQRPDGTIIIDDYSNFFDPAITLTNPTAASVILYWIPYDTTGTAPTCNDWTTASMSSQGRNGNASESNNRRLDVSPSGCNNGSIRILCISYVN